MKSRSLGQYDTRIYLVAMGMFRLSSVSNQMTAANDFANGEEAEYFSGSHTDQGQLLVAEVAHTIDDSLRGADGVAQGGGVAERIDERREVRAERGQVTAEIEPLELTFHGDESTMVSWCNLRRVHVLTMEDESTKLEADLAVVDSRGDHA